jgi:hypothetical protein
MLLGFALNSACAGDAQTHMGEASSSSQVASSAPPGMSSAIPAANFGDVSYFILLSCATPSCHTPNYQPPDLSDFNSDLVSVMTNKSIERCGNAPLVKPGDAAGSALVMILKRECPNLIMPVGCSAPVCIEQEKLEAIASWINAGALR